MTQKTQSQKSLNQLIVSMKRILRKSALAFNQRLGLFNVFFLILLTEIAIVLVDPWVFKSFLDEIIFKEFQVENLQITFLDNLEVTILDSFNLLSLVLISLLSVVIISLLRGTIAHCKKTIWAKQNRPLLKKCNQIYQFTPIENWGTQILLTVATVLVIGHGIHLIRENTLTPGYLLVFIAYLKLAFKPLGKLVKIA